MALFTESQVRAAARIRVSKGYQATATSILIEKADVAAKQTGFDIFLSHSIKDSELVLGTVELLEKLNYTVYVDWIVDKQLDRSQVKPSTAGILRKRMRSCNSLFYLTTENASTSRWMPWECGYFDGLKEKVAILPLSKEDVGNQYYGQEYLGLYPYGSYAKDSTKVDRLWVRHDAKHYLWYNEWVQTPNAQLKWNVSE